MPTSISIEKTKVQTLIELWNNRVSSEIQSSESLVRSAVSLEDSPIQDSFFLLRCETSDDESEQEDEDDLYMTIYDEDDMPVREWKVTIMEDVVKPPALAQSNNLNKEKESQTNTSHSSNPQEVSKAEISDIDYEFDTSSEDDQIAKPITVAVATLPKVPTIVTAPTAILAATETSTAIKEANTVPATATISTVTASTVATVIANTVPATSSTSLLASTVPTTRIASQAFSSVEFASSIKSRDSTKSDLHSITATVGENHQNQGVLTQSVSSLVAHTQEQHQQLEQQHSNLSSDHQSHSLENRNATQDMSNDSLPYQRQRTTSEMKDLHKYIEQHSAFYFKRQANKTVSTIQFSTTDEADTTTQSSQVAESQVAEELSGSITSQDEQAVEGSRQSNKLNIKSTSQSMESGRKEIKTDNSHQIHLQFLPSKVSDTIKNHNNHKEARIESAKELDPEIATEPSNNASNNAANEFSNMAADKASNKTTIKAAKNFIKKTITAFVCKIKQKFIFNIQKKLVIGSPYNVCLMPRELHYRNSSYASSYQSIAADQEGVFDSCSTCG